MGHKDPFQFCETHFCGVRMNLNGNGGEKMIKKCSFFDFALLWKIALWQMCCGRRLDSLCWAQRNCAIHKNIPIARNSQFAPGLKSFFFLSHPAVRESSKQKDISAEPFCCIFWFMPPLRFYCSICGRDGGIFITKMRFNLHGILWCEKANFSRVYFCISPQLSI